MPSAHNQFCTVYVSYVNQTIWILPWRYCLLMRSSPTVATRICTLNPKSQQSSPHYRKAGESFRDREDLDPASEETGLFAIYVCKLQKGLGQ